MGRCSFSRRSLRHWSRSTARPARSAPPSTTRSRRWYRDHWGDLCASPAVASEWADRLIDITRLVLSPDRQPGTYFKGTTACLSALERAGRHDELIEIVRAEQMWTYRQWAVKAMLASGRSAEVLRFAEASRNPWSSDHAIDASCEEILLRSGMRDEAYTRYGIRANGMTSHLATFRAVTKKYPDRPPHDVLMDLVNASPGQEGKCLLRPRTPDSSPRPSRWRGDRRVIREHSHVHLAPSRC